MFVKKKDTVKVLKVQISDEGRLEVSTVVSEVLKSHYISENVLELLMY